MLSQKSVLKVIRSERSFSFVCQPDSPIQDVQSALLEMLAYVQAIIKNAEEKAKEVEEKPVAVEAELITEQTL